MTTGKYGPIEVFRAGTFTPMGGTPMTITTGELQQLADTYDKENAPAPVVIGHPATDAPAFGWVDKLYVEGGILKATLEGTVAQFADWVKQGLYKKVSIATYLPKSTSNPKPGSFYLRHVGFLGAAAPAVPGLKPVAFAGAEADILEFSQDVKPAFFAEQDELDKLRAAALSFKLETLISQGRVLPLFKDEILTFADSLDNSASVSFSDGTEATRRDWFFSYLARQPVLVNFGEVAIPEATEYADPQFVAPAGYTHDKGQDDLYMRARQIEREQKISFADAVDLARVFMK